MNQVERLRYLEAPLDLFCGHDSTTLDKAEADSRRRPGEKRIDRYDRTINRGLWKTPHDCYFGHEQVACKTLLDIFLSITITSVTGSMLFFDYRECGTCPQVCEWDFNIIFVFGLIKANSRKNMFTTHIIFIERRLHFNENNFSKDRNVTIKCVWLCPHGVHNFVVCC